MQIQTEVKAQNTPRSKVHQVRILKRFKAYSDEQLLKVMFQKSLSEANREIIAALMWKAYTPTRQDKINPLALNLLRYGLSDKELKRSLLLLIPDELTNQVALPKPISEYYEYLEDCNDAGYFR